MNKTATKLLFVALTTGLALLAQHPDPDAFTAAVQPGLAPCMACHNPGTASGGLDITGFEQLDTVDSRRERWEMIVHKVKTGEMPPPNFPKLDEASKHALVAAATAEFDRLDSLATPDPGRVTARRLNRVEYSNTIRDLLGVRYDATEEFPSDDSGHGFDNIGDVLTISPTLMDKYVYAAEVISRRALAADPLPAEPVETTYEGKAKTILRLGPRAIEARHRVEWPGEYDLIIGLPGERAEDAEPVLLRISRDGETIHEAMVDTKPGELIYFSPYSEHKTRVYLPAGDFTFRAAFINDEFPDTLEEKDRFDRDKNKFLDKITFIGPYPSDIEPESRKRILTCDPNSGSACVRSIVARLAKRAYRRPVTEEEVADLLRFVELAKAEGLSVEQGIQLSIQAMLVSPHFLFRIEQSPAPTDPDVTHRITDYELASRLSYFLWSSMPDDELFALAGENRLHEPEVLHAQVDRLLADPRSQALAENFSGQWLETRNLNSVNPDPDLFPSWGAPLREAMKRETALFFEEVLRENLPLGTFIDADFTFLNATLAKHYGVEGVRGDDFQRVSLAGKPQRGGVLSHASVLTVTSYPTRTSPVIRGKYVLENILGTPPPEPPSDVPSLEESSAGPNASVRQQLEAHRANPACASCHARMDALGFGLENYNAIGQWREAENDKPVDSSGVLPSGEAFESPAELRQILSRNTDEFARAITEKMLIYSLGRGVESYDRITVKQILKSLEEDNFRFQTLVHQIVGSLPFQQRRGEAVESRPQELAQR